MKKELFTFSISVEMNENANSVPREEYFKQDHSKRVRGTESLTNNPEVKSYIIMNDTLTITPQTAIAVVINYGARYLIDLCLIYEEWKGPSGNMYTVNSENAVATWLDANDNDINFIESAPLIEAAHKIQHPEDIKRIEADIIDNNRIFVVKNVFDIMDLHDIESNQFKDYLKVVVHPVTPNDFDFSSSTFNDNDRIFAAPLFKAIVDNHGENVIFSFGKISFRGDTQIVLQVSNADNSLIGYYDFTHRPRYIIDQRH